MGGRRLFTRHACAHSPNPRESLDRAPAQASQPYKEEGRKRNLRQQILNLVPGASTRHTANMLNVLHFIRLDYLSCILTVLATVLIGKKLWQGWVVAAVNSAVVCVIGVRTAQFGFVPANLLCIALYTSNLVHWRPKKQNQ